jgi:hypothetical protein
MFGAPQLSSALALAPQAFGRMLLLSVLIAFGFAELPHLGFVHGEYQT